MPTLSPSAALALSLLVCYAYTAALTFRTLVESMRPCIHRLGSRTSSAATVAAPSSTRLYSYGDPDNTWRYRALRRWQEFARDYEHLIYPQEPDIAGLTFASSIEWAPWMETIWFGNYYDYRSAYFHDVMYSNNQPGREGALLFRDPEQALQVALLYQRYKKFDASSYSAANATFFNLFGEETLRIGKYKVPQSDSVVLCATDPLTASDVRRYLNSFNALKGLRSLFLQQKRKRQYLMSVDRSADYARSFFPEAVHKLEYLRILDHPVFRRRYRRSTFYQDVPILSTRLPLDSSCTSSAFEGLVLPIMIANSQYVLENLCQGVAEAIAQAAYEHRYCEMEDSSHTQGGEISLRDLLRDVHVTVGGDGRLLNDFAIEMLVRVLVGHQVGNIHIADEGLLCTSAAKHAMKRREAGDGEAAAAGSSPGPFEASIVLTAPHRNGGIKGYIGIKILLPLSAAAAPAAPDNAGRRVAALGPEEWSQVVLDMGRRDRVRLLPTRPPDAVLAMLRPRTSGVSKQLLHDSVVTSVDAAAVYAMAVTGLFDLPLIQRYLASSSLFVSFDCMHGVARRYLDPVLQALGVDLSGCYLNQVARPDFDGCIPSASAEHCSSSISLFNVQLVHAHDGVLGAGASAASEGTALPPADCPDLGFVVDADVSRCLVSYDGGTVLLIDAYM